MSTRLDKNTEKSTQPAATKPKTDETEHPVDARLRKLNDEILPKAPYILSCPASLKDEFVKTHYPQNVINWKKFSLFKPGEEELQYLTFKDRSDDGDIRAMHARGGWDDGKGRIATLHEPYSRASSDGTPRQGPAPKKKITLAEYQNKDRSKAATPTPKPSAPEHKEPPDSANQDTTDIALVKESDKPQGAEYHGQKRTADTMADTKDNQTSGHHSSSPPLKKARVGGEASASKQETQDTVPAPETKTEPAVDKLEASERKDLVHERKTVQNVAPTPPSTSQATSNSSMLEKPKMPALPPMLSPLSSMVEEEIRKLTSVFRDGKNGAPALLSSQNSPLNAPAKPNRTTTPITSKVGNRNAAENVDPITKTQRLANPANGPQGQKQKTMSTSQTPKDNNSRSVQTPKAASVGQLAGNKAASTPTPKTTPPDAPKRMRLRIALKIKKKSNRKNLMTYLSLKPTRGRNALFPNRPIEQEQRAATLTTDVNSLNHDQDILKVKRVDQKQKQPVGLKMGNKRGSLHNEEGDREAPSKRKHAAWLPQTQKPSTPNSARISSPALSLPGSAQKPSIATPNAQSNGAAMLRAASGQGSVHTPQQSTATGTPTAPSTGRLGKAKSPDLRPESRLYLTTATTLKHEADVFLKKQAKMNEDERKQGLVLGTESVLCFMLAFVLLDTGGNYTDRNSWNSIIPFLSNLQEEAHLLSNPKHMSGLLCQLEAIIRDQITHADLQILDKNPLKHELGNPHIEPGRTQEQHKASEYHKYFQDFHNHVVKAQAAWRSGWMKLDVSFLQSEYPETWARREEHRYAYGKSRDAVTKGDYKRKYLLPMNNMTSGLEAVNFGMTFLAEWSKSRGIEWRPKLVL